MSYKTAIRLEKNFPGNESNLTQDELQLTKKFEVYVPYFSRAPRNRYRKVSCPGCSKQFPASRVGEYSPDFHEHCVKECQAYKKLGE